MPSAWVIERTTQKGKRRHVVRFRVGGRESRMQHWGSYRRKREADAARDYVAGELAHGRVPERRLVAEMQVPTFTEAARSWQSSRVDVAENTRLQHRSAVRAMLPALGSKRIDQISIADVTELVRELSKTRKRETVRKSLLALAMVFDHASVSPNVARDKAIKLPREVRPEIVPPTADAVEAVARLLPRRYVLPLLLLDATGARVGELAALTWADVDEQRGRWRVSAAASKTRTARWVSVPPLLFEAVTELVPREDRVPERKVFQGFGVDRFRTAIRRACVAAGVPVFSPHDLRHRRVTLLHLSGTPWSRIGEAVGQRNLAVTANTYSHVLADETELDYAELLSRVAA
ncbi:MAG TPA: site-specific integrase [Gaiellaceae bacterium]|nr:site-specific integrase [Gaiellaceae bacterium]